MLTPLHLVADAAPASTPDGSTPDGPSPPRRIPRWADVALAVCGGASLVALVAFLLGADQRALQRLPAHERAALYERTMENLTSVCASEGRRSLHDFCRDQAQLALMFPECDRTCVATARELLRIPAR